MARYRCRRANPARFGGFDDRAFDQQLGLLCRHRRFRHQHRQDGGNGHCNAHLRRQYKARLNPWQECPMTAATLEQALDHGLSADEWKNILRVLNRAPNVTELGIFSVMWSEHCSYKSSRIHLRTL